MQIRDKAFFYDLLVILDGVEISSYFFRDIFKRYFFFSIFFIKSFFKKESNFLDIVQKMCS